jgi:hypothetical protein
MNQGSSGYSSASKEVHLISTWLQPGDCRSQITALKCGANEISNSPGIENPDGASSFQLPDHGEGRKMQKQARCNRS